MPILYKKIKFLIKSKFYPILSNLNYFFSKNWSSAYKKFGAFALISQLSAAIKVSKSDLKEQDIKKLEIVFLTILGSHFFTLITEIIIGLALKARGHKVSFVLDDMVLPINEHHHIGKEGDWPTVSYVNYHFGRILLNKLGLDIIKLSNATDCNYKPDLKKYEDILTASILKHYRVGEVSEKLPDLSNKKELIIQAILLSAKLGHFISKIAPDRVIMSHGIYSTWGPAREVLIENNIDVITYTETKTKNTIRMNWKESSDIYTLEEAWVELKNNDLTDKEDKKLEDYLKTRISHSKDLMIYNFGHKESQSEISERLKIDQSKAVYSLYTNVVWDAASAQKEVVFDNAVDWVMQTISWFIENPEKQLIVKIHPAEVVIGTKQPFLKVIKDNFSKLPSNIIIIPPDQKVNRRSIYDITDCGIVHTSTPGLELPLSGKPCIVVSETHYRNKGFTIDVKSKKEYFNILNDHPKNLFEKNKLIELSRKYAYLFFIKCAIPFPFIESGNGPNDIKKLNIDNYDSIIKNRSIHFILKSIENKSSFVPKIDL